MNKCEWKDGVHIPCCDKIVYEKDGQFTFMLGGRVYVGNPDYCPHCGADIRKPVEIKVGMLVKAKNSDIWSVVKEVRTDYVVLANGFTSNLKMITPGIPEGFNQDGTPKEIEE